jgi:K+-sensing histidine kinase KdpD
MDGTTTTELNRPGPALADSWQPHVLACLSGAEDGERVVRAAAAMAYRLGARITILLPFRPGDPAPKGLDAVRALAARLWAPCVELPVFSPVDGVLEYANTRGVTHIVVQAVRNHGWPRRWQDQLAEDLTQQVAGHELFILDPSQSR